MAKRQRLKASDYADLSSGGVQELCQFFPALLPEEARSVWRATADRVNSEKYRRLVETGHDLQSVLPVQSSDITSLVELSVSLFEIARVGEIFKLDPEQLVLESGRSVVRAFRSGVFRGQSWTSLRRKLRRGDGARAAFWDLVDWLEDGDGQEVLAVKADSLRTIGFRLLKAETQRHGQSDDVKAMIKALPGMTQRLLKYLLRAGATSRRRALKAEAMKVGIGKPWMNDGDFSSKVVKPARDLLLLEGKAKQGKWLSRRGQSIAVLLSGKNKV